MIGVVEAFSPTYAQARKKFLEAAAAAGVALVSHVHPRLGREGEELAMDVALDGSPTAERLLVVTSACHGVEGYCGTGVQVFALHDEEWRAKARAAGVAVLYVHGLNPHGFSHVRRVTQENVDLNRNFQDFSKPLPANEPYREIHAMLLPEQWPPTPENDAAVAEYIARRGQAAYQQAISGGQYEFADGMFFGGTAPTWSNQTFRRVLREQARHARRLAWIDIHTGLGPSGKGERIYAGRNDAEGVRRARAWWDGGGATPVTSIYDGSSTSAVLTGLMFAAVYEECPQAEYTGIAMEYGTLPVLDIMQALRADHWLHQQYLQGRQVPAELVREIKRQMLDAFYTDTDAWKGQIVSQARQSMFQAVDGLTAP